MSLDNTPLAAIEAVLLDVGGTLISLDFEWVQEELRLRGVDCSVATLERAEAAARPVLSRLMTSESRPDVPRGFEGYLRIILEQLKGLTGQHIDTRDLAFDLAPVLRPDGQSNRLWSSVLPGVDEALHKLVGLGLALGVVSNSDGTVDQSLVEGGIRHYFAVVVDSHIVGVEKPDPSIFRHALDALECSPEKALHVGDMYFADVVGARAAGVHAVLLDPFNDWRDVDCPRFPSLTAVLGALAQVRRQRRFES